MSHSLDLCCNMLDGKISILVEAHAVGGVAVAASLLVLRPAMLPNLELFQSSSMSSLEREK